MTPHNISNYMDTLTIGASAKKNNVYMLPKIGKLESGSYKSKLVEIIDAVANNEVIGIDCRHELTDNDGNLYKVCFRYFDESWDLEVFIDTLAGYGITGTVANAVGIEEEVIISEKSNSSYLKITDRKLLPSKSSTPQTHKKGILGSKRSTPGSTPKSVVWDDEEYDDFLDEED